MNLLLAFNGTCLNDIEQITTSSDSQTPSLLFFSLGNSRNIKTLLPWTLSLLQSRIRPVPEYVSFFQDLQNIKERKINHRGTNAYSLPPEMFAFPPASPNSLRNHHQSTRKLLLTLEFCKLASKIIKQCFNCQRSWLTKCTLVISFNNCSLVVMIYNSS